MSILPVLNLLFNPSKRVNLVKNVAIGSAAVVAGAVVAGVAKGIMDDKKPREVTSYREVSEAEVPDWAKGNIR